MNNLAKMLTGIQDARGSRGIASRGKNIYNSTSHAAHKGGGTQYGRPKGAKDTEKRKINYQEVARRKVASYRNAGK